MDINYIIEYDTNKDMHLLTNTDFIFMLSIAFVLNYIFIKFPSITKIIYLILINISLCIIKINYNNVFITVFTIKNNIFIINFLDILINIITIMVLSNIVIYLITPNLDNKKKINEYDEEEDEDEDEDIIVYEDEDITNFTNYQYYKEDSNLKIKKELISKSRFTNNDIKIFDELLQTSFTKRHGSLFIRKLNNIIKEKLMN